MILIECNRNHNLSIIFQPITAQYKKKAWQKEELFGFWYAVSLKRVMIWNSTFAFTLVNMHTKLLDYNRKGRGRYDPIFKGVNICIFGLIFAPLRCHGLKPTNIVMFLAFIQAKRIYLLSSLHHLTYFIQDSTYHRMIEGNQEANTCMYLYVHTMTGFVWYWPKTKKSFCLLKSMKLETTPSNSIIHKGFSVPVWIRQWFLFVNQIVQKKKIITHMILDEIRNFRP